MSKQFHYNALIYQNSKIMVGFDSDNLESIKHIVQKYIKDITRNIHATITDNYSKNIIYDLDIAS